MTEPHGGIRLLGRGIAMVPTIGAHAENLAWCSSAPLSMSPPVFNAGFQINGALGPVLSMYQPPG